MKLYITSTINLYFHDVSVSETVSENARALVKNKEGFLNIAICINGSWYDEGSLCYGGGEKITDVAEFCLI